MRCSLCGAVNAIEVRECITCGWHGQFWTSPEIVEEGLEELLAACPEFLDTMLRRRPKRFPSAGRAISWLLALAIKLLELAFLTAIWALQTINPSNSTN